MKTQNKIILGILAYFPIGIFLIHQIIVPVTQPFNDSDQLFSIWDMYPGITGKLVIVSLFTGILTMIGFIIHILKSNAVPTNKRTKWVVFVIILNVFSLPIYWHNYIFPESK